MPTPTYTPLANVTLASAATTVTFSSISGSYRDLILISEGSNSSVSSSAITIRFNSDSGSNYASVFLYGDGSSAASGATSGTAGLVGRVGVGLSNGVTHIMDYSATDKHKTVLSRGNTATSSGAAYVIAYANRWANTAAVTSFTLGQESAGQFAIGTTFALYGIAS